MKSEKLLSELFTYTLFDWLNDFNNQLEDNILVTKMNLSLEYQFTKLKEKYDSI